MQLHAQGRRFPAPAVVALRAAALTHTLPHDAWPGRGCDGIVRTCQTTWAACSPLRQLAA
eukprot:366072-Chlamydomonas_euryale.AAC.5